MHHNRFQHVLTRGLATKAVFGCHNRVLQICASELPGANNLEEFLHGHEEGRVAKNVYDGDPSRRNLTREFQDYQAADRTKVLSTVT